MNRLSYILLFLWICLGVYGCSTSSSGNQKDYRPGPDPDDPSVVYDQPFLMVSGYKTYNGNAYDKSSLWVDEKVKLVLPDSATKVIHDSKPHEVNIFMEKRISHGSHSHKSNWPIPYARKNMGCAVKLEKGSLLIGTFGEFSYMEGSVSIALVIHVPKGTEVERRAGLIGGSSGHSGSERPSGLINPTPGEAKPALTEKCLGQPDCWLPPTKEDGWHEIPAVADVQRQASRE